MRTPSPMSQDPYRTLGLEPGASMADVKRAYRRLAKAYHPDSAGEAALPRFLAIHEAYERIRTGRPAGPLVDGWGPAGSGGASAEPWRADPARARAARERASTARGRARGRAGARGTPPGFDAGSPGRGASDGARAEGRAGTDGARADGRSGADARAGTGPSATGPAGGAGPGPGARPAGSPNGTSGAGASGGTGTGYGGRTSRRSERRKATLGSTSYDEAHENRDASWSGASWYGPTSGEYWIINPREYADPRKHGPSYQARVRKATGTSAGAADADSEPAAFDGVTWEDEVEAGPGSATGFEPSAGAGGAAGAGGSAGAGRGAGPGGGAGAARARARTAGRSPRAAARGASQAARSARPTARTPLHPERREWAGPGPRRSDWDPEARAATWSPAPRTPGLRELLGGPADDPIRRLGLALVAWPPIGLAAAAAIGDVTGCASFSAACQGTDSLLPWLAQAGILGLLLLLPPLARLLAAGSVAVVLALVPVTGFLVVVGGAGEPQAAFALAFLLALAWLAGLAWSIAMTRRRGSTVEPPFEPPLGAGGPS